MCQGKGTSFIQQAFIKHLLCTSLKARDVKNKRFGFRCIQRANLRGLRCTEVERPRVSTSRCHQQGY
jgi:hypothetical protein